MVDGDTKPAVSEQEPRKQKSNKQKQKQDKPRSINVDFLKVIYEAQQQHGLRHGDYQRYRGYCSRRLRRIRKTMNFLQGDMKKYKKKEVTVEHLENKDDRYLLIPLMSAERAWAYGMQLKHEGQTERRKHLHMIERLRKAVHYANILAAITEQSTSCRNRTKQEAKAYAAGMNGVLKFEQENWNEAKDYLMEAQTVYMKLGENCRKEPVLRAVYDKKVEELRPLVTFSAYNIGDESAMQELQSMQGQGRDLGEIDNLIAATRQKEAASVSEFPVTWRERTVLVTQDKVRMFVMSLREHEGNVAKAATNVAKIAIAETLLFNCKDAMQVLRDELKTDPGFTSRTGSEGVSDMHYLYTYFSYIRLQNTIQRNMFMIDNTTEAADKNQVEGKPSGKALQDSIRLYEINLQNLTEIQQLPTVEDDPEIMSTIKHQVTSQKALRCFAIAESLAQTKKSAEALVLYDRSKEYVAAVISSLQDASMQARLLKLQRNIDSRMLIMQAQAILASDHATKTADKAILKKRLTERLDEFVEDPTVLSKQPNIAVFPPEFTAVPCKPLFFDLALNHVEMPNLDAKLDVQPQAAAAGGLTGLVKGLWGWGK